ncbi:hypothetical protein LCGC14_2609370 [marine sediment metagenome]|uniref:Uncharacterized protein n=1 Tax=marine sediment metagenome TaxID=412755 RepID=A0A0F9A6K4_9ZZZZ
MIFLLVIALTLIPVHSFAQGARNASGATLEQSSRSNFTSIGLLGLAGQGNPGYIAFSNATAAGYPEPFEYYLWVKSDGDLCIASHSTIISSAGFPNGDWTNEVESSSCTVVGGQS